MSVKISILADFSCNYIPNLQNIPTYCCTLKLFRSQNKNYTDLFLQKRTPNFLDLQTLNTHPTPYISKTFKYYLCTQSTRMLLSFNTLTFSPDIDNFNYVITFKTSPVLNSLQLIFSRLERTFKNLILPNPKKDSSASWVLI